MLMCLKKKIDKPFLLKKKKWSKISKVTTKNCKSKKYFCVIKMNNKNRIKIIQFFLGRNNILKITKDFGKKNTREVWSSDTWFINAFSILCVILLDLYINISTFYLFITIN